MFSGCIFSRHVRRYRTIERSLFCLLVFPFFFFLKDGKHVSARDATITRKGLLGPRYLLAKRDSCRCALGYNAEKKHHKNDVQINVRVLRENARKTIIFSVKVAHSFLLLSTLLSLSRKFISRSNRAINYGNMNRYFNGRRCLSRRQKALRQRLLH